MSDLIENILKESASYKSIEEIEALIQQGASLAALPVEPLYLLIKESSSDIVVSMIPKLSSEQRQLMLDLDVWTKDQLSVDEMGVWLKLYMAIKDEKVQLEFINSSTFSLFLKKNFQVYEFDQDDPNYPEHDYFFITDDNLLLFEFDESFEYVEEVTQLIRLLYSDVGVENAYAHLVKIITSSESEDEEEEYALKKGRLSDYGFVDYYDALGLVNSYPNQKWIDKFVKGKKALTPEIDSIAKNQTLSKEIAPGLAGQFNFLQKDLDSIKDAKRLDFLRFNFVRLINASLSLEDAFRKGRYKISQVGKNVRDTMGLGYSYLKLKHEIGSDLFLNYDFFDLYRIGNSLINEKQKTIKNAISQSVFSDEAQEYFLGQFLEEVYFLSYSNPVKIINSNPEVAAKELADYQDYLIWDGHVKLLVDCIPFANTFYSALKKLKDDGIIHSSYYLNYDANSIDFESILISLFLNYLHDEKIVTEKVIGIKKDVLFSFFDNYIQFAPKSIINSQKTGLEQKMDHFGRHFGLEKIHQFSSYLFHILKNHLEGYTEDEIKDENLKYIGGPIIFNA